MGGDDFGMLAQGRARLKTGILSRDGRPTLEPAMPPFILCNGNMESQDYIEGPRAFAEKRKPDWLNG